MRISLLTIPVRLYSVINTAEKISFNQLHRHCHQRLKQQLVCPVHGSVKKEEVVKGFPATKNQFAVVEPQEVQDLKIPTSHVIEVTRFVQAEDIDQEYLDTPYILGSDRLAGHQAFSVLKAALQETGKVAIGQVVMSVRERLVAIGPGKAGLKLTTLRYGHEVQEIAATECEEQTLPQEQVKLAIQLIENQSGPFDPNAFEDRYQSALKDLIQKKLAGSEPVQVAPAADPVIVIDLQSALQRSVANTSRATKPARQRKRLSRSA